MKGQGVDEPSPSRVRDLCCSPLLEAELPMQAAQDLAIALKVLADPVRLRLLSLIRAAPGRRALTRTLVASLDVTQPTVTHHLGVLHDAGFVVRAREGRETWYSIEPDTFHVLSNLFTYPPDGPADRTGDPAGRGGGGHGKLKTIN
jgi:ArsR family transcriptional regulator